MINKKQDISKIVEEGLRIQSGKCTINRIKAGGRRLKKDGDK